MIKSFGILFTRRNSRQTLFIKILNNFIYQISIELIDIRIESLLLLKKNRAGQLEAFVESVMSVSGVDMSNFTFYFFLKTKPDIEISGFKPKRIAMKKGLIMKK